MAKGCECYEIIYNIKGKAIPLEALTGPEGSRRLFPMTVSGIDIGTQ
jgi:hypothetical protein